MFYPDCNTTLEMWALMYRQRFQVVYPVLPMDLLGVYVLLPE